jgi:predicted MFS family arabinose efflux permease
LGEDAVLHMRPALRHTARTLFLAGLGGALENFDFVVFALFIRVIGRLFFPPDMPEWVAILQTFGVFAAGNFARPLGGIVIAHFGDRVGRKKTFTFSILLMAVATLGIAVTPTFATIGSAAPVLLLMLRILQGAALGGELPGAWTFMAEHVSARRVGFACGILTSGLAVGNLLGALSAVLVNTLFTPENVLAFAWRLPFVMGGIFALVAVYLRRWLAETPIFQAMQKSHTLAAELPLKVVLRGHRRGILISAGLAWLLSVAIVVVFVMTPTLLQTMYGIDVKAALQASSVATVCLAVGCIVSGLLADLLGGGLFMILGAPFLAACTYLLFAWLPGHPERLFPLYALAGLSVGVVAGIPLVLVNSFPPAVRFTGISFSYNISYAVFSGFTPPLIALGLRADRLAPAHALMLPCLVAVLIGIVVRSGNRRGNA